MRRTFRWDADSVRGLRRHLAVTQEELAAELGVRQQTISEWETGAYQPRGASERVLTMVAEQVGFVWHAGNEQEGGSERREAGAAGKLEAGGSTLEGEQDAGSETREAGGAASEAAEPGPTSRRRRR